MDTITFEEFAQRVFGGLSVKESTVISPHPSYEAMNSLKCNLQDVEWRYDEICRITSRYSVDVNKPVLSADPYTKFLLFHYTNMRYVNSALSDRLMVEFCYCAFNEKPIPAYVLDKLYADWGELVDIPPDDLICNFWDIITAVHKYKLDPNDFYCTIRQTQWKLLTYPNLFRMYQIAPMERTKLVNILKCALVICVSDDLLKTVGLGNAERFFNIMQQLPIELQMRFFGLRTMSDKEYAFAWALTHPNVMMHHVMWS
jgi:hypothetical protein